MSGRKALLGAAIACTLVAMVWAGIVFVANRADELSQTAGFIASLAAAAASLLFLSARLGWLGAACGFMVGASLVAMPYISPLRGRNYGGEGSFVFGPSSETHLYYVIPGVVAIIVAIIAAFESARVSREGPASDAVAFYRFLGGALGLLAALILMMVFVDGRTLGGQAAYSLLPCLLVAAASLAAILLGGAAPDVVPGERTGSISRMEDAAGVGYRGQPNMTSPSYAGAGASGDPSSGMSDLLRALAHAPPPGAVASMTADLPAGTLVGRFSVFERLGAGGMGIVYRAKDVQLGREVALKLIPPALALDPARRQRFLKEARAASSVSHPSVASVFEVADGEVPYIAMELITGGSLRARLARGPLPPDTAKGIAMGIAAGLAAAHARGIVHRDLKPDNVMLTEDGHVKLVDFGLARAAATDPATAQTVLQGDAPTRSGIIVGTPRYMAPEQAMGDHVDARADVYAFGLVYLEVLTGQLFEPDVLVGHRAQRAASAVFAVLPSAAELVGRCLAFDPANRFANAAEIVEALRVEPGRQPAVGS